MGGTEIFLYHLAKNLQARNHQVHVIVKQDKDVEDQYFNEFHIHRVYYPEIKIMGYLIFLIGIFLKIMKLKPDLIQINILSYGILGLFVKKFLRIPYIIRGTGSDVNFLDKFNKIILKRAIDNSSGVIALTEYMKDQIAYSPDKIHVIANGININSFEVKKNDARHKLGIAEDKQLLIFVGGLRAVKGVKYLIKAIYILKNTYKDYIDLEVLIIGDGKEKNNLETTAKELDVQDVIEFVGKVDNNVIPLYLAASDIFILPSLSEGLPVVLLESLASGLPIIASDITGISEIIENGKNGFVVKPKNPAEISEKIIKILEDEDLQQEIFINNKIDAKKYNWTNIVDKYEELYRKMINNV